MKWLFRSVCIIFTTGKFSLTLTGFLQVYQREELQMIADLCIKHDIICISDEVYEWLTYDGTKHVKIGKSRPVQVMQIFLWTFKVTYLFFFWQPVCQVCGNALSPLGVQARLSVPPDGRWAGQIQQDLLQCYTPLFFLMSLTGWKYHDSICIHSMQVIKCLSYSNVGGLGNGFRTYPKALKNCPSEFSVSLCHSCPGKTMLFLFFFVVKCVICFQWADIV